MAKFAPIPEEKHELLVTYEGPFHPSRLSSRKTFCITLPSTNDKAIKPKISYHVSEHDILNSLAIQIGWPSSLLCLRRSPSSLIPTHSVHLGAEIIYQHEPLTAAIHPRHTALLGGKGGFGTLLKGQSKQAGARQTLDFGACRDLSGRRLRHVNDEIKLRKFRALEEARERGEKVDELAALKTESGIRNWHLMVPNWSDGASMSNKGRRKHERQLEREVRGWQSKEERAQRQKEHKRMEEEWAINEYVRRGEVEGGRVSSGDAAKEMMLAQLRKKKEEKRLSEHTQKNKSENEDVKQLHAASLLIPADKESEDISSSSHLMTLSGEVSVFDLLDDKQRQSFRLQSQSDFATVVILLDSGKMASCMNDGKTGIYAEYTIQSAGLAQIGWICSPDPQADDSQRFLPNSDTGDGVGDDAASYGYDGSRGLKFHDGKELPYGQDQQWKSGDTLGCWCRLDESKQSIEIGYKLNSVDLGVAFSLHASSGDLSRYFPAVSLNLSEVVDVQFGSGLAHEGCISVSDLVAIEDCNSSFTKDTEAIVSEIDQDSGSPPKKKARDDKDQKQNSTALYVANKSEMSEDLISFDLNSCNSIDELVKMDHTKLKNILLSMGVKCGGTPQERAERLFSLKGLRRQDYPNKVRGKNFVL